VRYGDGKPLETNAVKKAIDDAVARLGQSGRLVIRPSGTEPLIRVMAEGDDATLVTRIVDDICQVIAKAA
jgi:phosphoglucosamine mutase